MKQLLFIIGCLFLVPSTLAQDASFIASVNPSTPSSGEQFTLSFTVSGSEMPETRSFKSPDLSRFVVMSGPNLLQNMQFINGRMSASVSFNYYLYAREAGKYQIGAATVEMKGKTIKSETIQIEVVAGKPKPQQSAEPESAEIGDNVFIKAIPTKTRVKQGEQLTVTYKLYTRVGISDYSFSKVPTFEGFWGEDFEMPKNPQVTTEMYQDKQHQVVTLKKTALFATQTGTLQLAPLKVKCAVQVQSRKRTNDPFDIFNDPFFGRMQTVEYEPSSNALSITVDRLPEGAPEGFAGAVGKYSFSVNLDKNKTKTGDPITVRITASGSGNIKLLTLPKPIFPSDFEVYEPKVSEEISREGGVIRGKKIAEYLVVPRNAGKRTIDPMSFTYFDLERNSYVTHRSAKFEIEVEQGKVMASGGSGFASKEDVRLLGEDIRFLKLDSGVLRQIGYSPFRTKWFFIALLFPPFVFVGAFVYRKRVESLRGNVSFWKAEKAGKEATKRLKLASKLLASGRSEDYHSEVSKALLGYLCDKLHISQASLSLERAISALAERDVEKELVNKIESCIHRAEYIRFAPGTDSQEGRKDLLDEATDAIRDLENVLN